MSAEEIDLLFWNLLPAVILGTAYAIWKFWTHHQAKAAKAAARLATKAKRKNRSQTPKKPNHRHGRN
jgi:hypothetical protein